MKKIIILLLLSPSLAFAVGTFSLDKGKTEFLAVGTPGFLKIRGKGKAPEGEFKIEKGILSGEVKVHLKTLDTGMSLRNKHMKEKYLQVEKYPYALLKIEKFKMPESWSLKNPVYENKKVPAEVQIHGEKKNILIQVEIDEKASVKSQFEVKITDFAIDIPSFMGVTVADKVNVEIESHLVAKN